MSSNVDEDRSSGAAGVVDYERENKELLSKLSAAEKRVRGVEQKLGAVKKQNEALQNEFNRLKQSNEALRSQLSDYELVFSDQRKKNI